jgi:hypothetical protein
MYLGEYLLYGEGEREREREREKREVELRATLKTWEWPRDKVNPCTCMHNTVCLHATYV